MWGGASTGGSGSDLRDPRFFGLVLSLIFRSKELNRGPRAFLREIRDALEKKRGILFSRGVQEEWRPTSRHLKMTANRSRSCVDGCIDCVILRLKDAPFR